VQYFVLEIINMATMRTLHMTHESLHQVVEVFNKD